MKEFKIKAQDKSKIIAIILQLLILLVAIAVVLVLIFNNPFVKDNKYCYFKYDCFMEVKNKQTDLKKIINTNIEFDKIEYFSDNETIAYISDGFLVTSSEGVANITAKVKDENIESVLSVQVLNEEIDENALGNYLYFDKGSELFLSKGEEVSLNLVGVLKDKAVFELSNTNVSYNRKTNTIKGLDCGHTELKATVSFGYSSKTDKMSICASIDIYIEDVINTLEIDILDKNFVKTTDIHYNTNEDCIDGYIEIKNCSYLFLENIEIGLNFAEVKESIVNNNKFLIPFSLNNWGKVIGKIKIVNNGNIFEENILFNSFNENITKLPESVNVNIIKNGNIATCEVTTLIEGSERFCEYEVYFVLNDVETKPAETTYICNFETNQQLIVFEFDTSVNFSIKVVLKNIYDMDMVKVVN